MGGGGQQETGSTETEVPDWIKDRYETIFGREDDLYNAALQVAKDQDPTKVLMPNKYERAGLAEMLDSYDVSEGLLTEAADTSGMNSAQRGLASMLKKWQGFDTSGYDKLAKMDQFGDLSTSDLDRLSKQYKQLGKTGVFDGLSTGGLEDVLGEYGDLASGSDIFSSSEAMQRYLSLAEGAGADFDTLLDRGGTLTGDALRNWSTDRIGDKTLDEMRAGYESDYTDDVVNTTLASADLQRAAERKRAAAEAAAVGGAGNTRSAIGQAVSDQLFGLNRAQTEAQLRDDAFRTAAEFGQAEAQLGQNEDAMNYGAIKDALGFDQSMLETLGGITGAKADTMAGIMSDYLAQELAQKSAGADWDRGILGDKANLEGSILGYGMDMAKGEADWSKSLLDARADLADRALGYETDWTKSEADYNKSLLDTKLGFNADALGQEGDVWQGLFDNSVTASDQMSDLAGNWANLGTQRGGALAGFGEMLRGLKQQQASANNSHNMTMIDWLSNLSNQNETTGPSGVGTTTQTEATPGFGQTVLGLGATALGAWLSDERSKEQIEDAPDGALNQILGLGVKSYRYRDGEPGHRTDRHQGLIAQDVEARVPGGTFDGADGRKRIDPYVMAATIVKAVQELNTKVDNVASGVAA